MSLRDPIEFAADEERDLQGIATWEPRSLLDRFLARYLTTTLRVAVVLLGLLIFAGVSLLLLVQVVLNPRSAIFVLLFPFSVLPALALTAYVWYTDISREPVTMLIVTYLLGIVLASFPYLINTVAQALLQPLTRINVVGFFVQAAQFYFVVAPVEEVAKLAAVFMFVYWRTDFDSVVDGAVYGAIAGLGFATIENISYIIQVTAEAGNLPELLVIGGLITTVRSLAGPGHVIWTGIAGYYLGLAKFNQEYALALTVKGLLIATFLHGTYNTLTTAIGQFFGLFGAVGSLLGLLVTFGFILAYHTAFFGYLFWKVRKYRTVYAEVSPGDHAADLSKLEGYRRMRARATGEAVPTEGDAGDVEGGSREDYGTGADSPDRPDESSADETGSDDREEGPPADETGDDDREGGMGDRY